MMRRAQDVDRAEPAAALRTIVVYRWRDRGEFPLRRNHATWRLNRNRSVAHPPRAAFPLREP